MSAEGLVNSMITSQLRSGLSLATLLAIVWAVAAAIRPTSTFHLAPILIAGAAPIAVRHVRIKDNVLAAALGGAISLAIATVLSAAGMLQGPSLLPAGGAFAEAVVFTAIGAAGGVVASALGAVSEG